MHEIEHFIYERFIQLYERFIQSSKSQPWRVIRVNWYYIVCNWYYWASGGEPPLSRSLQRYWGVYEGGGQREVGGAGGEKTLMVSSWQSLFKVGK